MSGALSPTNEDLVRALMHAVENDCDSGVDTYTGHVTSACTAVLARMSAGWQPLPEERERSKLGNVLIAGMYPDGRTMSDVYHDWWTFGGWARWPHPFPPTHYMAILPLPASLSPSAALGRPA